FLLALVLVRVPGLVLLARLSRSALDLVLFRLLRFTIAALFAIGHDVLHQRSEQANIIASCGASQSAGQRSPVGAPVPLDGHPTPAAAPCPDRPSPSPADRPAGCRSASDRRVSSAAAHNHTAEN